MSGWIKLYRSEMDSTLYHEEPFTKWQAWMDLWLMAQSDSHKFQTKKGEVNLLRGQLFLTTRAQAKRWAWSRGKVERFLKFLSGHSSHFTSQGQYQARAWSETPHHQGKILVEKKSVGLIITILSYGLYQSVYDENIKRRINQENQDRYQSRTPSQNQSQDRSQDRSQSQSQDRSSTTKQEDRRKKREDRDWSSLESYIIKQYSSKHKGYVLTSRDKKNIPLLASKISLRIKEITGSSPTDDQIRKAWSSVLNIRKQSDYWRDKPLFMLIESYEIFSNDMTNIKNNKK